jgi:AcrR family transcriptional regulator
MLLLTNHLFSGTLLAMTSRQSAAERREAILDAAVEEIAVSGFSGATTADVARRAGISQPYVFRFFPTKKDLALAVIDRCVGRIIADWETAVPGPGESRLETLGRTYVERLPERRSELMVHLSGYAEAEDPDVAAAMRHHLARIFRYVSLQASRDGCENAIQEAAAFIGRGFLINAAMAVGLESELTTDEWFGICPKAEVARVGDRGEHIAG